MVSSIASFVAGGVVGHVLTRGQEQALTLDDLLKFLSQNKPQNLFVKTFNAQTARSVEEVTLAGDFLLINQEPSTVNFAIRLNEPETPPIASNTVQAISSPFYRLFLTNVVGNGSITLIGGRGTQAVPRFKGIEELAARLGSIVTFDRRGDVVWIDDFEAALLKWQTSSSGLGGAVALSTTNARNGNQSVLLTGGSDSSRNAFIRKQLYLPASGRLGVEFSFSRSASVDRVELLVTIPDGTNEKFFFVRWRDTDDDLQYLNNLGAWVTIASDVTLTATGSDFLFHTMKLVFDVGETKFIRLVVDGKEYSLENIDARITAVGIDPYWQADIVFYSRAGSNDTIHIDDVVFTRNE